ncbi:MAG: UPF0149 family protein [Wenzhouxiangellaceae bacterium]|nr:UPF0149 family protein [Wenzhouxiangellaceae bacterium]
MQYNPAVAPDTADWLGIVEDERLYAIQCWLAGRIGAEIEDCLLEAAPILLVENQVAANDPPITRATLERLLDADIDRMTAIQVMAGAMSDSLRKMVIEDGEYDRDTLTRALQQIDPADISLDVPGDDNPREAAGALPEFAPDQRRVLIEFGERHADEKAMSWPETAGFLVSVVACPEMILPSEWTEIVRGEVVFRDVDEARAVAGAQMALMNWVSECIAQNQPAIPEDCRPDPQPMRILEADNDFSRWCRGLTSGHLWLEDVWNKELVEDGSDDRSLGMALIIFSFFGDRKMAEKVVEETARESGSDAMTLEETARTFHRLIDQAAVEYAAIGLEYRRTPTAPIPLQPVRSEKIGRNQPCPCGSGIKYKKCCGRPGARHNH